VTRLSGHGATRWADRAHVCVPRLSSTAVRRGRIAYTPDRGPTLGHPPTTAVRRKGEAVYARLRHRVWAPPGGICGCGLGLGFLLHWLVPAIDRGMATLCGLVATGVALLAFGQLMTLAEPAEAEEELSPVWRLRPLPRPARATRRPRKRS
jgi:hypothetical protein